MVEVKLRTLSKLGLSSDTPANLTHKGKTIPENSAPISHIDFGMTEMHFIHLSVAAQLYGGMMQGLCSSMCDEPEEYD